MDSSKPDPATVEYWTQRAKDNTNGTVSQMCFQGNWSKHSLQIERFVHCFVKEGASVLDLGCGFGHFGMFVQAAGGLWHGVDFCPEMEALWKERLNIGQFRIADVRNTAAILAAYDGKKFDVVMACCMRRILGWQPAQVYAHFKCLLVDGGILGSLEVSECFAWNKTGIIDGWLEEVEP